jgi:phage gpG-like protein
MSKFQFDKKAQKFRSQKSRILEVMANNAINFFKVEVFDKQGFIDKKLEPWKPRKAKSKRNAGRKILVDTGRLRQSITVIERNAEMVKVGTNVPYAEYHNKGTENLPQRQFIGISEKLNRINKKTLALYSDKIL